MIDQVTKILTKGAFVLSLVQALLKVVEFAKIELTKVEKKEDDKPGIDIS